MATPDVPAGALWWCVNCATNIPADEVNLATWDSPHGEESHTVCGSGDLELLDERREVA
jgi:hypothetical protein